MGGLSSYDLNDKDNFSSWQKETNMLQHLKRTSDLKGTRQCALNLSGPFLGQLSVRSLYNRNVLQVSVKLGAFTGVGS